MDKIIKVKDSQVSALLAFYEKEQITLSEEIKTAKLALKALEQKYQDAIAVIDTLKDKTPKNGHDDIPSEVAEEFSKEIDPIPFAYPKEGSWWEKIKWVLHKKAVILSAAELNEAIYDLQPELDGAEKKLAEVNIFSTLSNKFKNEKISRIKSDGEYKYALNQWFDEKDELIPDYDSTF
jgi:hypothetical protein